MSFELKHPHPAYGAIKDALTQGKTWDEAAVGSEVTKAEAIMIVASEGSLKYNPEALERVRRVVEKVVGHGMGQRQAAEQLHISPSTVSGIVSRHINRPLAEELRPKSIIHTGPASGDDESLKTVRPNGRKAFPAMHPESWGALVRESPLADMKDVPGKARR